MIRVLHPGIYSSVQDLGRSGYRSSGVPVSGAMDQVSARLSNSLLGNLESCALLEFNGPGLQLQFDVDTQIVYTGANAECWINDRQLSINQPETIKSGSIVKVKRIEDGVWGYLAVKGGVDSEKVMGSRSQYWGITAYDRLRKEMVFSCGAEWSSEETPLSPNTFDLPEKNEDFIVSVSKGPEFDRLSLHTMQRLQNTAFRISSQSNRMAILFDHDSIISAEEIITASVRPGIIQLTPSGKLILLMRDAQTTGGYARVLQLDEAELSLISQLRPGEKIKFKLI